MNNQQNPTNIGDGINLRLPPPVHAHNQVVAENKANDALRMQPLIPCPQAFYRGNANITNSTGSLVIPSLPQWHTFMVTSILMQVLTARGLF